ncbi:unnamed protein product [Victoria cruziana]
MVNISCRCDTHSMGTRDQNQVCAAKEGEDNHVSAAHPTMHFSHASHLERGAINKENVVTDRGLNCFHGGPDPELIQIVSYIIRVFICIHLDFRSS